MGNAAVARREITLESGFLKNFVSNGGYGFVSVPGQKDNVFILAKDWQCYENRSLRRWKRGERKDAPHEGDAIVFERLAGLKASAWGVVPRSNT